MSTDLYLPPQFSFQMKELSWCCNSLLLLLVSPEPGRPPLLVRNKINISAHSIDWHCDRKSTGGVKMAKLSPKSPYSALHGYSVPSPPLAVQVSPSIWMKRLFLTERNQLTDLTNLQELVKVATGFVISLQQTSHFLSWRLSTAQCERRDCVCPAIYLDDWSVCID